MINYKNFDKILIDCMVDSRTYRNPASDTALQNYSIEELKNAIKAKEKLIDIYEPLKTKIKINGHFIAIKEIKIKRILLSSYNVYKILIPNTQFVYKRSDYSIHYVNFEFDDITSDFGKIAENKACWMSNEGWIIKNSYEEVIKMYEIFRKKLGFDFSIFKI